MTTHPALKTSLQRDVFLPIEERLVGFVSVIKPGKKRNPKKASYLCATVTTERPIQPKVYLVKKAEKADGYKRKMTWSLKEMTAVDGKDAQHENQDFDLVFEKTYKWVANTAADKDSFIACLWRLCQRYVEQKASFMNVPLHLMQDTLRVLNTAVSFHQDDGTETQEDDYEAISAKEETDLEKMMSQCEFAVSNAELFAEQLSKDLSVLDGANIHSMMESEDQVLQLMELLDDAIREATKVDTKLNRYNDLLKNVADSMEIMKDKDTLIQVQNGNHTKLMDDLSELISKLDLNSTHEASLLDGDLSSVKGIYSCTQAAEALQKCMDAEIHPALIKMQAVQEQTKRFNRYKKTFAQRLARHLNKLFIQQGNQMGETLTRHPTTEFKISPHSTRHRDLTPYAELLLWLKTADPESCNKLKQVYTASLCKLYDKEVKDFMESTKHKIMTRVDAKKGLNVSGYLTTSSSSLDKVNVDGRQRAGSIQSLDSHTSNSSHDFARAKFDQLFEAVLSELEPVCLEEQAFCVKFFHLTLEPKEDEFIGLMGLDKIDEDDGGSPSKHKPMTREEKMPTHGPKPRRQLNTEVRKMLGEMFPSLESELLNFITFGDKLDAFNSMYMLTRMSQHVNNAQDTGSFLSVTFASSLVHIKRNFDKFIKSQISAIEEYRAHKKSKCGILPFVCSFEEFAHKAEVIFQDSVRRADLEKAYHKFIHTIFQQIQRIAVDHPKTPRDVVIMENFHHLFATLSQLKISCLESERKEARQKYNEHLNNYVTTFLGRPMEKLNTFFDGIEAKVASGVKAEEVGYQLAYSKNELRKVTKEYPGKEVKKGLESLCKKVDKHLCDEENLFQVVWHSMQDEFIKQYKHFEQLIERCYPGSQISLEFTIEDILQYFSDMAQA